MLVDTTSVLNLFLSISIINRKIYTIFIKKPVFYLSILQKPVFYLSILQKRVLYLSI